MTEPVSASTLHTLACRLPSRDGCGTRVHTIPVALATPTAATRSRTCSYSSSSISRGTIIASTHFPRPAIRTRGGCPGASARNQNLTGVPEGNSAQPEGQGPGARLAYGLTSQREIPASAGSHQHPASTLPAPCQHPGHPAARPPKPPRGSPPAPTLPRPPFSRQRNVPTGTPGLACHEVRTQPVTS